MSILTTEDTSLMPASKVKVLIADDAEAMRQLLKAILKKVGFVDISETKDGDMTIKDIQKNKFDLVICDWEMPGPNGDIILKQVRESKRNNQAIFIMCTANANAESVQEVIEAGVSNYIIKPLNPKTMVDKLSLYFELNR